jgi:hypothetical protein
MIDGNKRRQDCQNKVMGLLVCETKINGTEAKNLQCRESIYYAGRWFYPIG